MELLALRLIYWIVIHPVDSSIQCLNNWGRIRVEAEGSRTFLEFEIICYLKEVSSQKGRKGQDFGEYC